MSDNTIEIRDDEINVEEIMQKIRENVRNKKNIDTHPIKTEVCLNQSQNNIQDDVAKDSIQFTIDSLNYNWDIHNNSYFISSHRPYIGNVLIKGRKLIHGEVRRYVDPVILTQSKFNKDVAQLFPQYQKKILELENTLSQIKNDSIQKENTLKLIIARLEEQNTTVSQYLEEQNTTVSQRLEEQNTTVSQHLEEQNTTVSQRLEEQNTTVSQHLEEQNTTVSQRLEEQNTTVSQHLEQILSENANFLSGLDVEIENKLRLVTILDKQFQSRLIHTRQSDTPIQEKNQINYMSFEEHFRGSRHTIKVRQYRYLPFFEHGSNVLDIGCGRGEFLELLKEHDIGGIGIDINKDMVEYCQSKGLDAKQIDALEYLNILENTILDGIFSDQVIEHLTPDYLIRLLHLSYQKLKPESYLVLGTVNILNPGGLANFFVDPTHVSPIHPEYLKYCLEVSGFRDVQIIFRTYDERENNQNISDLCSIAADYTIVGKK